MVLFGLLVTNQWLMVVCAVICTWSADLRLGLCSITGVAWHGVRATGIHQVMSVCLAWRPGRHQVVVAKHNPMPTHCTHSKAPQYPRRRSRVQRWQPLRCYNGHQTQLPAHCSNIHSAASSLHSAQQQQQLGLLGLWTACCSSADLAHSTGIISHEPHKHTPQQPRHEHSSCNHTNEPPA